MTPGSPLEPFRSTPEELRERLVAERRGTPFLVLRDDADVQRIVDLGPRRRAASRSGAARSATSR